MKEFEKENNKHVNSPAYARLNALFDTGTFHELDAFVGQGETAGVICGYGQIFSSPAYAFSQNIEVDNGAVGKVEAGKIKKVYDLATKTGVPIIGIYDSNGAKLDEGIDALTAYGDMLQWSNNISGVVPQISVVAGPCAGVSAMVACAADFLIMSEGAELFMNAPAILQAESKTAPDLASASANDESGLAHITVESDLQAVSAARDLLSRLPLNNLDDLPSFNFEAPEKTDILHDMATGKAEATYILDEVADKDSILYMQKGFGLAIDTAFIGIDGSSVGALNVRGFIDNDSCRKAARFIRFCDAYSIPIVTFLNTLGFSQSIEAETNGIVRNASILSQAYTNASTAKVTVIGTGVFGASYIAFAGKSANADLVLSWNTATISLLPIKTAVSILFNERIEAGESMHDLEDEYLKGKASSMSAAKMGAIDKIIAPSNTREEVLAALSVLVGKRATGLPKKHANSLI